MGFLRKNNAKLTPLVVVRTNYIQKQCLPLLWNVEKSSFDLVAYNAGNLVQMSPVK